ncbi:MAG TPA: putative Ig domain-containing protein [Candidatus Paceibacterota bacterium]|nr:putative Ig domain-containing protein [Candidatus Paceibacterota bacterium]
MEESSGLAPEHYQPLPLDYHSVWFILLTMACSLRTNSAAGPEARAACRSKRVSCQAALFCLCALLLARATALRAYDWDPPPAKITILVVNAHPDDEGIFFGGTLPYYTKVLGVPAMLLSMTSGDWTPSNLTVREEELRCAAWTYGFRYEPLFPRFRDVPSQSLANNPYTNKIDATWDYWADGVLQGDGSDVEAGKLKAINYVAEQIRRYCPDVIITHDLNGEYGHDNHRATAWAVTNAFFVAADPTATATNVAALPPWQACKLYLHLYPTNRLFHKYTEIPFLQLTNLTPRQVADIGLDCHVSQGRPDVSTVYRTGENFDGYHSEWWGLYASTVGADSVLTNNIVVNGYVVTNGVAAGNFLENIPGLANLTNDPPSFVANPIVLPVGFQNQPYHGQTLARWAVDPDLAWDDELVFSKLGGPAWLTVAADGTLSGTPALTDVGTNSFLVRVEDRAGLQAETLLLIAIRDQVWAMDYLSAWWKLDDPAISTVVDSAAPAQNGVGNGGVTPGQPGATPFSGTSFCFDGATNSKVEIPYSAELNPPVFTVALWAKVTGGGGTYRSPLTSRRDGPQSGYVFYAGNNNTWQFWVGTGSGWRTLAGGAVVTNAWMHLAGSYDGATLRFYTNGVLANSAATVFRPNDLFPVRLGAGSTEGPGQYWFPGCVDDVRLYRAALTDAQIQAIYANAPPAFTTNPLVLAGATIGQPYSASLTAHASDPNPSDALRFTKTSGPAWLTVAQTGTLSGTPTAADLGLNSFLVSVMDDQGASDEVELRINVGPVPVVPAFLAAQRLPDGRLQLLATGSVAQSYVLWATPTLGPEAAWAVLATNTADANGSLSFVDVEAPNHARRFYRIATP